MFFDFVSSIMHSKSLLISLIKNDFKQKYIGNFLGFIWAFIQPMTTILIFWFVFQVGFKSQPVDNFPFILWLIAGILPWFYFAEGLAGGTNSILTNSYLVKKIVFRVELLPIIPLFSALIIHLFFIIFMFFMYLYYGYKPSIYWIQIFYYLFAISILLFGLSLITSSVVVFFRDMGQLVAMFIQFGFWLTPIFWAINTIPERYHWVINLNPIAYIIEGYRNSMIYHKWFWEDMYMTIYFWSVTIVILMLGILIFKRLRPHFADVI